MQNASITHAMILALNAGNDGTQYDAIHGGETILNRALVALSKSGIKHVTILCKNGHQKKIENLIRSVHHRLNLNYSLAIIDTELSQNINEIARIWDTDFLLFNADTLVHPTFLTHAVAVKSGLTATLFCYNDIVFTNGQAKAANHFTPKFKTIFEHPEKLRKIIIAQTNSVHFQNVSSSTIAPSFDFSYTGDGIFTMDVLAVTPSAIAAAGQFADFDGLIKKLHQKNLLQLNFVHDVWWLRVYPNISRKHITDFFWKIAFKEVSGEFSKLVNSKFSKPLSFFFARLGVAPNTLSAAQMVLYIVASLFLLINAHWAMIAFALIWQFSAGVLDRCDGETARIRNYESEGGAKFDVLVDDLRFGIPFFVLTLECYIESGFDLIFPVTTAVCVAGFLIIVFKELSDMRKAGYQSRQFMAADIFKMMGQATPSTKLAQTIRPFFKGDIRTFYISVIALFGIKTLVFWVLAGNVAFMAIMGIASIVQIKKLVHFKLMHKG